MKSQKLTTIILIGMVLGILVGWGCHELWPDPKTAKTVADYISLITDIFLRLIKMIIAPLVFSTLVVGVAHMGDTKAVGRIGGKAMLWFVGASLVSLFSGVACAALGDKAKALVEGIDELSHVILKITGYIMGLAPLAVFAAMAAIITTQGLGILVTYGKFVLEFYFGLIVLWGILIAVGFLVFGSHAIRLVNLVREPFLLAFSTASSEAA